TTAPSAQAGRSFSRVLASSSHRGGTVPHSFRGYLGKRRSNGEFEGHAPRQSNALPPRESRLINERTK
ncbi:MAG: hypothetical protein ORN98_05905, partial [Alphaproteobacteria bacterium]|nr:hypothetical protein [Alphaproteobacteria bacterium]